MDKFVKRIKCSDLTVSRGEKIGWHRIFTLIHMNVLSKNSGKGLVVLLLIVFVTWFLFSTHKGTKESGPEADTGAQKNLVMQASVADTPRVDNTRVPIKEIPLPVRSNNQVDVKRTDPGALISFAKTLVGVPYVYASADPNVGFDCSGFITYVFHHFNIAVPRSSIDFSNLGKTVNLADAKMGDLILFTGTNELERHVGHMGIVISNDIKAGLQFIHSTSGKAMSVTITQLNDQYRKRFVRVSRVFGYL